MSRDPTPETDKPNLLNVVCSTFAAAFGIQSGKNRERDFKHGNLKVFIIAGIVFTIFFVFSIVTLARLASNS